MHTLLPLGRRAFRSHFMVVAALLVACTDAGPRPLAVGDGAVDQGLLETNALIRGRDGGYSARLFDRSVWLYGDTILSQPASDGRSWRHNSWSYTADFQSGDGIAGFVEPLDEAGAPVEFFPQTDDERTFNDIHFVDDCTEEPCGARWALWPGVPVWDGKRGRALVFYHLIYAEPGEFNFEGVGSSVAVWEDFEQAPVRPEFRPGTDHPTLLFPKPAPSFGSAALVVDELLYLYGCQTEGWDKPCYLARVPLADALEPDAWRYLDTAGEWRSSPDQLASVFEGNDMMSMAWSPAVGAYVAIYSQPLDARVMMRSAMHPEGPWSKAVKLFDAQPPDEGEWIYDAMAHPELAQDDGQVQVVTYSRNTGFLQSEVRVVEVKLQSVE